MEFKYILSHKRPFRRFMHSLCKNENILMCGKAHCQFVVCCWFSSLLVVYGMAVPAHFFKMRPKQAPSHTLLFHLTARKWNSDFAFVFEIT